MKRDLHTDDHRWRVRARRLRSSRMLVLCALLVPWLGPPLRAQAPDVLDRYTVPVHRISSRSVGDPGAFASPTAVEWVGGLLVIIDRKADSTVIVLRTDGRTERTFGRRGKGPGEFEAPWSAQAGDQPGTFWVYDAILQRLTKVDLKSGFPNSSLRASATITLAGPPLDAPKWVADGRILSTGTLGTGRFVTFDSTGQRLSTLGNFTLGDPSQHSSARQAAYRVELATNPSRDRLVTATVYSDRLEILNLRGEVLATAERPFGFEPTFRTRAVGDEQTIVFHRDVRFGYIAVTCTDRHIFALFSGRTLRAGQANMANYIHVYDWTGKLRAVLKLDAFVMGIAVDPLEQNIYALKTEPLPGVAVFTLPPEIRNLR